MTWTVLNALLSHWRRRPFQLLTLILGLSLATALWSGVQAINAEARKSYGEAADVLAGGGLSELVRMACARSSKGMTFTSANEYGVMTSLCAPRCMLCAQWAGN